MSVDLKMVQLIELACAIVEGTFEVNSQPVEELGYSQKAGAEIEKIIPRPWSEEVSDMVHVAFMIAEMFAEAMKTDESLLKEAGAIPQSDNALAIYVSAMRVQLEQAKATLTETE